MATVVPNWIRANATRGLLWYHAGKAGAGVTAQTIHEAALMAAGFVSQDKARRMVGWFARHMVDLDAPSAKAGAMGFPSHGAVAHALWGGGSRTTSVRAAAWAARHARR